MKAETQSYGVEVVKKGLLNSKERVTFGVYVPSQHLNTLDLYVILMRHLKNFVERMEIVRKISRRDIKDPKVLVLCEGPIDIEHMLCNTHRYWKYEVVLQPLMVRSLKDMCMELCLEYFLVQDHASKEPRFRFSDYKETISSEVLDLLVTGWKDAKEKGMMVSVMKKGMEDIYEARFSYHNPIESGSAQKCPHPTEDFIITLDHGASQCEFFSLFQLSLSSISNESYSPFFILFFSSDIFDSRSSV